MTDTHAITKMRELSAIEYKLDWKFETSMFNDNECDEYCV